MKDILEDLLLQKRLIVGLKKGFKKIFGAQNSLIGSELTELTCGYSHESWMLMQRPQVTCGFCMSLSLDCN